MHCPVCAAKGKNSLIRKFSINYNESVYLCVDAECDYLLEPPQPTSPGKFQNQVQQTMESHANNIESFTMQGNQTARSDSCASVKEASTSTEDDSIFPSLEIDVVGMWDVPSTSGENECTLDALVEAAAVPDVTNPSVATPGCDAHDATSNDIMHMIWSENIVYDRATRQEIKVELLPQCIESRLGKAQDCGSGHTPSQHGGNGQIPLQDSDCTQNNCTQISPHTSSIFSINCNETVTDTPGSSTKDCCSDCNLCTDPSRSIATSNATEVNRDSRDSALYPCSTPIITNTGRKRTRGIMTNKMKTAIRSTYKNHSQIFAENKLALLDYVCNISNPKVEEEPKKPRRRYSTRNKKDCQNTSPAPCGARMCIGCKYVPRKPTLASLKEEEMQQRCLTSSVRCQGGRIENVSYSSEALGSDSVQMNTSEANRALCQTVLDPGCYNIRKAKLKRNHRMYDDPEFDLFL